MITITLAELTAIIGGKLQHSEADFSISGDAQVDSRLVAPGDIFIALPGENTDGHLFLSAAAAAGAVLAIVTRFAPPTAENPIPQLLVSDPLEALRKLATATLARVRQRVTVVGITGSNGKTTTKNLVGETLAALAPTVYARASANNEIGFPQTVLRLREDTRFLVLEYGAIRRGDIAYLREIATPDVAVVLNVGHHHASTSGGLEKTQLMKAELLEGLPASATLVLNLDDPRVVAMKTADIKAGRSETGTEGEAQPRIFGFCGGPAPRVPAAAITFPVHTLVSVENISSEISGTELSLRLSREQRHRSVFLRLQLLGEHSAASALAAWCCLQAIADRTPGFPLDKCVEQLARVAPAPGRMQLLSRGASGGAIINDAFNASPESASAALLALARLARPGQRRVAILGQIYDLGEHTLPAYRKLAEQMVRLNVNLIVIVGARPLYLFSIDEGTWDRRVLWFEESDAATLAAEIQPLLASDDLILVKASNAAGLQALAKRLAEPSAESSGAEI